MMILESEEEYEDDQIIDGQNFDGITIENEDEYYDDENDNFHSDIDP